MLLKGILFDFSLTFIIGMGWAYLYEVPKRQLWLAGLLGGIGHATRYLLMIFDVGIITATMAGCVLIGLLSVYVSYYVRKPSVILTMPACITMVPGLFAYRTMMGGIQLTNMEKLDENPHIILEIAHNFTLTISLLFALAIGISIGAILSRKVGRRP